MLTVVDSDGGVAGPTPVFFYVDVAQADNVSPLPFSTLLEGLFDQIRRPRNSQRLLFCNDLVIYGSNRFQLKPNVARLYFHDSLIFRPDQDGGYEV